MAQQAAGYTIYQPGDTVADQFHYSAGYTEAPMPLHHRHHVDHVLVGILITLIVFFIIATLYATRR